MTEFVLRTYASAVFHMPGTGAIVREADGIAAGIAAIAPFFQGASAYQIAVLNGFVGTEAAWLASLATGGPPAISATADNQISANPDGLFVPYPDFRTVDLGTFN